MFARIAAVIAVAVAATSISASAIPRDDGSCSTGPISCCNSTVHPDSTEGGTLTALLGLELEGFEGLIGITCSPIPILGISSISCTAQTVCCKDNAAGGLVSIGCVPVIL